MFDADGTLFDYDAAEAAALSASFARIGQSLAPELGETYRRINSEMWRAFESGTITQKRLRVERFERLFEAAGIELDPVRFADDYLDELARRTELVDGAETTVAALAEVSRLLIITNGIARVQRPRFAASAIRDYFIDIVISEEVGAAKPERKIFDAAFATMNGASTSDVLIVGDSLTSDIEGGKNYGIDTCWFNPTGRPATPGLEPTFEIARISELLGA